MLMGRRVRPALVQAFLLTTSATVMHYCLLSYLKPSDLFQ